MTQLPQGAIPEWTLGDRLRKARGRTGLTTREFAELIGVSQKTVTDAEGDKREGVRKILLNAWSMATGVPVEWLRDGVAPVRTPPPNGGQTGTPNAAQLAAIKARRAQRPASPFTAGYLPAAA